MLSSVVEQIAQEHPEIKVCKVNVDEETQLARQFQVTAIPTLVLFRGGKPVASSVGFKPKATIEEMIK
ncbi:Thioredoxin [bioreactor metagenome]|uniref:Thioredoxin n=1 Tax=bioreactor metagenome TaxID=1076179 RepID=A0A645H1Y5_9ZZZZ